MVSDINSIDILKRADSDIEDTSIYKQNARLC